MEKTEAHIKNSLAAIKRINELKQFPISSKEVQEQINAQSKKQPITDDEIQRILNETYGCDSI